MIFKIFISFCLLHLANAHDCNKTIGDLGDKQGKFLHCVVVHSVPVNMCIGCKLLYDDLLQFYDKFTLDCNATYFDKDRINLVPSSEALLTGLWTKAYCDDCFNNNNSINFNEKYTTFNSCLEKHKHQKCDNCKNEYKELNDFYLSLDRYNDGQVCFDIQDSMNRTRYKWSKEYQCCLRQYNVLYFSIALAITTCVILTFYYSTYLITKRQERNHGLLNDEDPLFHSPSSSSAAAVTHFNISNNQAQINRASTSINEAGSSNTSPSPMQIRQENKVSKADTADEDSSDDEPLINKNPSMIKEKLK